MAAQIFMQPLSYQGVRLSGGIAEKQFWETLDYFLKIPEDDILYGFRKRAGLSCPGKELGGWYSNDGSFNIYEWDEIFNTFGQWLSYFAKAYVITGSAEVYGRLYHLIHEWGKTIEEDGYFFYSRNNNAVHYSYEKIMAGLVDAFCYAGIEEAEVLLDRITQWAQKYLPSYKNMADGKRATFTGGEPSVKCVDNEWYTLPENLYRAYLETGRSCYRTFAEKWHYEDYWEGIRKEKLSVFAGVHGYSHVNTLCSAAMAYQVTGKEKYLQTIAEGYRLLMEYQVMASGGYAFDEHMAGSIDKNYYAVETIAKSFEAACGSYAVLKLTRYLLMFTGKAEYGDWAERVIYNSLFSVLPMKDDEKRRGKTFYYADYRIGGGRKVYYEHSFPCCSGTYPQDTAEYHNVIYFENKSTIFISQFLPSEFERISEGEHIHIRLVTGYPEEEKIRIVFEEECRRKVRVRIPSWVREDMIPVKLNGKMELTKIRPGEWYGPDRQWKKGDTLEFLFPMHLYTIPISKGHPERAALMYGPVMLAAEGRHKTICADAGAPEKNIIKKDGRLEFVTGNGKLRFIPYWEYGEKEWNTVYLDYIREEYSHEKIDQ